MLAKKEGSAPSREASLQGCLGNAVYRDQPPVGGRTWKWRSKTNDCGYSWRLRRLLGFRWWPFGTIKLVLPLIKDTFADANLVRSLCFDPKPEIARISHGLDAYPEFFLPPVKISNKSHVSRESLPLPLLPASLRGSVAHRRSLYMISSRIRTCVFYVSRPLGPSHW